MGAFYLIGIDLQAGHGVGLAVVGHQEISAGLVGVGVMGAFVHGNEAGEDGFRVAVECVFVEKIGVGTFGGVMLEGALVELLLAVGDGNGEHV